MKAMTVAVAFTFGAAPIATAYAQTAAGSGMPAPRTPIVLVDSTGKIAARPLNDTIMLVAVNGGSAGAPAFIRPIYDGAGHTASGLATWQSGGSVLFTSADCTGGAYIFSLANAGVRSTTQVETPAGIMLYIGAIGTTATAVIHSILYASGCSPVTVQQNGLIPVEATVNLTIAFPPPLTFQ